MASNPPARPLNAARRTGKALVLVLVGLVLVPVALFESASQMPGGRASPIQLPLLTTPAVLNVDAGDRARILRAQITADERKTYAKLGARRLAGEPLDPTALWLFSLEQKPAGARRSLELANKVSRRERVVQLELMRTKALAGDLRAGLTHLDRVLTVSPLAGPQILRSIAAGLSGPELVRLFKPYEQRPWFAELLQQTVEVAPRAENAAELLLQSRLELEDLPQTLLPKILTRLAMAGDFSSAEKLVNRFVGIKARDLERFGPELSNSVEQARPLTWTLSNGSDIESELTANGVIVEVGRDETGVAMTRITGIEPGAYSLVQDVESSREDLGMVWKLQCLEGAVFKQVWSQRIPVGQRKQTYQLNFSIPSTCRVQNWEVLVSNQSGSGQGQIAISNLKLRS